MHITKKAKIVEMIDMFRIASGKEVVRSLEEQNALEGTEGAGEGFVAAFVTQGAEEAAEKALEEDLKKAEADKDVDGGEEQ